MGYTHYWTRKQALDPQAFLLLVQDVETMLSHLPEHSFSAGNDYAEYPLIIRGSDGTGTPQVDNDCISFNGDLEGDMDHETFDFPRVFVPESWQQPREDGSYGWFCKTARKPYDLLVCGTLLAAKHHFAHMKVSSDGRPRDWQVAIQWYLDVFPDREPPFVGL